MILNWKTTADEFTLISAIADRAMPLIKGLIPLKKHDIIMDLTACHLNARALDLEGLLTADHFNFSHDVFGIMRHLDRDTGKLQDGFVPRYAASVKSA